MQKYTINVNCNNTMQVIILHTHYTRIIWFVQDSSKFHYWLLV